MTSAQTPNFSHTTFETREIVKLSKFCVSVKWHCAANKVLIIGRISRVSRQVASKQVILRAIERYGVSLHFRRNRLKQPKFRWKTTFWCKKRLDLGLEAAEKMNIAYPPLAWSQQLQFYKTMTFLGWDDLFCRKRTRLHFFCILGFSRYIL